MFSCMHFDGHACTFCRSFLCATALGSPRGVCRRCKGPATQPTLGPRSAPSCTLGVAASSMPGWTSCRAPTAGDQQWQLHLQPCGASLLVARVRLLPPTAASQCAACDNRPLGVQQSCAALKAFSIWLARYWMACCPVLPPACITWPRCAFTAATIHQLTAGRNDRVPALKGAPSLPSCVCATSHPGAP